MLLASLSDAALEERLTGAPPRDKSRLRAAVRAARTDGYAFADGEVTPGFCSVAVPLHRWDGRVIAAMNLGGNGIDGDRLRGAPLAALRSSAADLSRQLV